MYSGYNQIIHFFRIPEDCKRAGMKVQIVSIVSWTCYQMRRLWHRDVEMEGAEPFPVPTGAGVGNRREESP